MKLFFLSFALLTQFSYFQGHPPPLGQWKWNFHRIFFLRITVQCLETHFLLLWLNGTLAPNFMTSNQAVAPGTSVISWIWAYDSVAMTYTYQQVSLAILSSYYWRKKFDANFHVFLTRREMLLKINLYSKTYCLTFKKLKLPKILHIIMNRSKFQKVSKPNSISHLIIFSILIVELFFSVCF